MYSLASRQTLKLLIGGVARYSLSSPISSMLVILGIGISFRSAPTEYGVEALIGAQDGLAFPEGSPQRQKPAVGRARPVATRFELRPPGRPQPQ